MTNRASISGILLLCAAGMACRPRQEAPRPPHAGSVDNMPLFEAGDMSMPGADSIRFPFVRFGENEIQDGNRLKRFYAGLAELQAGKTRRISVLHVGDSHVQAGFFTGSVREQIQERFGSAGRGLIVPFVLAGSHNNLDIGATSSAFWEGRLRTFQKDAPPIGLSGTALRAKSRDFTLKIWLKDAQQTGHDRLSIFCHPGQEMRSWEVDANDGKSIAGIEQALPFGVMRSYALPADQTAFQIRSDWKGSGIQEALLFGIVLESSGASGILYHAAGLNGATFYHFNRGGYFFEQIPALKPDLVIVSLGTNESLLRPFRAEALRMEARNFLAQLRKTLPEAAVLVASQPDALLAKTNDNEQGPVFSRILSEEAAAQGCAFWDLFSIMGGKGSIRAWKREQLAYKDMVHYTQAGYQLMGELLFSAIMRDYGRAD